MRLGSFEEKSYYRYYSDSVRLDATCKRTDERIGNNRTSSNQRIFGIGVNSVAVPHQLPTAIEHRGLVIERRD